VGKKNITLGKNIRVLDRNKLRKEFKKKYSNDTHLGIHCASELAGSNGSLIKSSPGDRNVTPFRIPGKELIEDKCSEERADGFKNYLLDAVEIRKNEILDKKDVPMVALLQIVSRNIPQKTESKNEHTFTFADMVKRATIELSKVDTVEV
jgi:hypothetical protein